MSNEFIEGAVRYPEDLPCPQVDTDLVPRERRYISDITNVRNLRMFQQEFQATRNRISFVFTEEEAREFREWYAGEIIHGGAWFYADWPILHKDREIAYRFVGQPKWEWLLGANPGDMGRSVSGYNPASDAVSVYKVTATVELYERKVGKTLNVYTSKIYPYYFKDELRYNHISVRAMPEVDWNDKLSYAATRVTQGSYTKRIYSSYRMADEKISYSYVRVTGTYTKWIYSSYKMADEKLSYGGIAVTDGAITARLIKYNYFPKEDNSVAYGGIVVTSGETS